VTFQINEDGIIADFHVDGTKVHRRLIDPNRTAILERNKELRRNQGAVRTTSFGKLELDIPIPDWKALCSVFPALGDNTHPDHKKTLRKFMASDLSAPYKVNERNKKRC
jgi:hypothetical protein